MDYAATVQQLADGAAEEVEVVEEELDHWDGEDDEEDSDSSVDADRPMFTPSAKRVMVPQLGPVGRRQSLHETGQAMDYDATLGAAGSPAVPPIAIDAVPKASAGPCLAPFYPQCVALPSS